MAEHEEDIVKRLMDCHDDEAGNEIERLRKERKDMLYQLEFRQAELAALAMDMNDLRSERDHLWNLLKDVTEMCIAWGLHSRAISLAIQELEREDHEILRTERQNDQAGDSLEI